MSGRQDFSAIHFHIAQALARDCTALYYLNMETGEFIEYQTGEGDGTLSERRRGHDFYACCARETEEYVDPEDREAFRQAMSPEHLQNALEKQQTIEITFRRIRNGKTEYMRMKVSRAEDDPRHVVIAVTDTDEQTRQRQREELFREERLIYARLHALTGQFIVVYVVDPATDRYWEFSATKDYEQSFEQAKDGEDFFGTVRNAAALYNDPDGLEAFLQAFTKEKLLAGIRNDGIYTLDYSLMRGDRPYHVQMKAAMVEEKEGPRVIIGLVDMEAQYCQKEKEREIERQKEIYNQITASLAEQYDTLYYIDMETSTYSEISATDAYRKLNVPATGSDFFAESRRSIRKYVHPEDQEMAIGLHYKDEMLKKLEGRGSYSVEYRLVVNGAVQHVRHTELLARDGKHLIVCIRNIDAEVQARLARKADQQKNVTYTQIAERLAAHYDLIYYVDCKTSAYSELSTKKKSGELKIREEGEDFFATSQKNLERLIYSEDRERIRLFLDRDRLISQLEDRRQLNEDYRMIAAGGKTQYTRMTVTYSSDGSHFIICVENRDEDVRREQEHLAALSTANEMARRDELTHTKNKTAYHEAEKELQDLIDRGGASFGMVVCDINGLKIINDTEGHRAGDDYIRSSCMLICKVFHHSPVFRVGGDEFVVILKSDDYRNRKSLLSGLRSMVEKNILNGEGPIVASGLATYRPGEDRNAEDVFNRADSRMYEEKTRLRELKLLQESHTLKEKAEIRVISEERRIMLDALYKSFEVVAEGSYVYLCDMKYDYSRWSKSAVDTYGLPGEYMYGAGDIWENQIHPDDRQAYHKGIDDIFSGNAAGHDMQYRARRVTGEYDVCTCRGVVIRDPAGEPDYFAGTIRNHGIQGHVDTLTGLRNQYGFFEDLGGYIKRSTEVSVMLFGISRFAEINEMYGYQFGNRVLQCYSRSAFETVGNAGHIYRIDGTRLAVISSALSVEELHAVYDRLRTYLHEEFTVDGKKILLELNCGALRTETCDIDSKTVYECLNYAYEESKMRRKGEMVEFSSGLNEDSHQRLEKLHVIRESITRGFEGFYMLYQPVVNAETEELIGAEALLRWKNDRYGTVPPDHFIPVLESDPLFPELGAWIIRESVITAKQILEKCPGFVINVNLSYSQLEKPDFVDMVLRILEDVGYPPENLCLEITERCRLLDTKLLKKAIVTLRARGILVALDDFGTGFSSVGLLKEIPIDTIKVDRSFVMRIEESEKERKIIRNIAELAGVFGAKVCVEGVETAGMRDILREFRVKSFQGYYYAKPLPPEKIMDDWL